MVVRAKWDKYEAAILLDAYMRMLHGELKRAEAIESVSHALRNRAVAMGMEIDDAFRNLNGISYQLGTMQYVVTGGKQGLPHAPMLFQKIYKLYREKHASFEKVLEIALEQARLAGKADVETSAPTAQAEFEVFPSNEAMPVFRSSMDNFKKWMRDIGLAERSVGSYASAINNIESFANTHGYQGFAFYGNNDVQNIADMAETLYQDADFIEYNNGQHNRLRGALRKFHQFVNANGDASGVQAGKRPSAHAKKRRPIVINEQAAERCTRDTRYDRVVAEVLRERFQNGYNPASAIDQARLIEYCRESTGYSDAAEHIVYEAIRAIGRPIGGRLYAPLSQDMLAALVTIQRDIELTFDKGAKSISCEMLYVKHEELARKKLHLYSSETLGELLIEHLPKNVTYKRGYFLSPDGKPSAADDVLLYLRNASVPVDYEELCAALWYHKPETIRTAVNGSDSIVKVMTNTYLYAYDAPISHEELTRIKAGIDEALLVSSVVSDGDLRAIIRQQAPAVLVNTESYASYGIRNVLTILLGDSYTFGGPGIGRSNRRRSAADVFEEYCSNRDEASLQELKELAASLNRTGLCWEQIYESMIRITHDDFVSRRFIDFDIQAIDAAIDALCDGEYITIREASLFTLYPAIEYRWSGYLLESYACSYSEKFSLVHLSYAEADCCGALVRKESRINSYEELIVRVLRDYDGWETTSDALGYLVERGFQQRRKHRKIEELTKRALLAREEMRA